MVVRRGGGDNDNMIPESQSEQNGTLVRFPNAPRAPAKAEVLLVAPEHARPRPHRRLAEHVVQVDDLVAALVADNHKQAAVPHLDAILDQRANATVDLFLHGVAQVGGGVWESLAISLTCAGWRRCAAVAAGLPAAVQLGLPWLVLVPGATSNQVLRCRFKNHLIASHSCFVVIDTNERIQLVAAVAVEVSVSSASEGSLMSNPGTVCKRCASLHNKSSRVFDREWIIVITFGFGLIRWLMLLVELVLHHQSSVLATSAAALGGAGAATAAASSGDPLPVGAASSVPAAVSASTSSPSSNESVAFAGTTVDLSTDEVRIALLASRDSISKNNTKIDSVDTEISAVGVQLAAVGISDAERDELKSQLAQLRSRETLLLRIQLQLVENENMLRRQQEALRTAGSLSQYNSTTLPWLLQPLQCQISLNLLCGMSTVCFQLFEVSGKSAHAETPDIESKILSRQQDALIAQSGASANRIRGKDAAATHAAGSSR
jgi:hypothetical protein